MVGLGLRQARTHRLKSFPNSVAYIRSSAPPLMQASAMLNVGQAVRHSAFGDGVVLNLEGAGEHGRALARFRSEGEKRLVLACAKLELIA